MNLPVKAFLVSGASLLLGACIPQPGVTPTPTPEDVMEKTTEEGAMMEGEKAYTLTAQSGSGQTGTAKLEEVDGQVRVTLDLTDLGDTAQPAHIHTGACPTPGEVTYPLTNVVNGQSSTVLSVSLKDLLAEMPLAVNVHKSAAEASVYTSCADIK